MNLIHAEQHCKKGITQKEKAHITADVGVIFKELPPQSQWVQDEVEASVSWGSEMVWFLSEKSQSPEALSSEQWQFAVMIKWWLYVGCETREVVPCVASDLQEKLEPGSRGLATNKLTDKTCRLPLPTAPGGALHERSTQLRSQTLTLGCKGNQRTKDRLRRSLSIKGSVNSPNRWLDTGQFNYLNEQK